MVCDRTSKAWDIVLAAREHRAAGGVLHSKGAKGFPSALRKALDHIDRAVPVTLISEAARGSDTVEIEHVLPWKRIAIELIDPSAADPRSNTDFGPIDQGPARSPEHMVEMVRRLVVKAAVTAEEHDRLNRSSRSMQWDAPNGDVQARYRAAGVKLEAV